MQREKGRKAEAEVAAIYQAHGFTVRGLEGAGDHLAIGHGLTIHSEVKRQEVLRLPLWARQAAAEAPAGAIAVVSYRRNREPWQAAVPAFQAAAAMKRWHWAAGIHYSLHKLNGAWWAIAPLEDLLEALAR